MHLCTKFAAVTSGVLLAVSLFGGSAHAATGTIKNVSTQLCLDSNTGGNVYTMGCNGGNFQNWIK